MSSALSIDFHPAPGFPSAQVVAFQGEIDETHLPELDEKLGPLQLNKKVFHVIFDFHDLVFVNSKGIGFIASFYASLTQVKKTLAFAAANENIRDILSLVGLTAIIPQFETVDQALQSLTPKS